LNKFLLFSDDWGRHPSSCQHLVKHFLNDYQVTWINTIGMRPPRVDLLTVRRGLQKFSDWGLSRNTISGRTKVPATRQPVVIDARMWPWMRRPWDRYLNRLLLTAQLREVSKEATAITTIPIVSDLIGRLPVQRWIYYCVDDFSVWPGLDGRAMLQMEQTLIAKADTIVAVSETLQARIEALGKTSSLLTHGVNIEHWSTPKATAYVWPNSLVKPIVLFWGVIDRRLDFQYLEVLAHNLAAGTIVLVGPQQNPDPRIAKLPNVYLHPPVDYQTLPNMAKSADCLIMPYADLAVTRAMQPLKLKEYMATGQPVVVSSLPAITPWKDCLDACENAQAFSDMVMFRIRNGVSEEQQTRRSRLAAEDWRTKAHLFERHIFGCES
jgi:glycosyltransferase involved in cell wall biosynthesis